MYIFAIQVPEFSSMLKLLINQVQLSLKVDDWKDKIFLRLTAINFIYSKEISINIRLTPCLTIFFNFRALVNSNSRIANLVFLSISKPYVVRIGDIVSIRMDFYLIKSI